MIREVDGVTNRPEGAKIAFLLVHGFSAAPDEVTSLGEYLADRGIASFAVRLAGHATTPEDLSTTTWHDWYESALAGLELVRSWGATNIFIAGLSMGGALSLLMAAKEKDVVGVVPMSPALDAGSMAARLVPILKFFMKYRNVDLSNMAEMYDIMRTKYPREPLSAYHELLKLMKVVRSELQNVVIPTLVIQSGADKTIDPENGTIVYEGVSSEDKALHVIPGAEHVITCHAKRFEAFELVMDFVINHSD
ncbi:MAG: alpha/beta hydrolase [Candidatus Thorarchaeota archaeon]|jgi:carboxylesterase